MCLENMIENLQTTYTTFDLGGKPNWKIVEHG